MELGYSAITSQVSVSASTYEGIIPIELFLPLETATKLDEI